MGQEVSLSKGEYPMSKEIKARIRQGMDRVWTQGDLDAIDAYYAADVVIHNAAPGNPGGTEGVRLTVGSIRAAMPDFE